MVAKIKTLCKERNITVQSLSLNFGWGANSVNRWDDNSPSIDKVAAVASYFGVSIDYIYYDSKDLLNAGEVDIAKKYRILDEIGKDTVSYIIHKELRRVEQIAAERQKAANIIPLWCSLQPASAGRGFYLSADEFETILVQKTHDTQAAAFAVPVSGDSMEPLYHDGDVLLVGREKSLSRGQIGIFTVDCKGYVKQLGDGVLVSLNTDYNDIPITEDTICNGNVIGVLDNDIIV